MQAYNHNIRRRGKRYLGRGRHRLHSKTLLKRPEIKKSEKAPISTVPGPLQELRKGPTTARSLEFEMF